VLRRRIANNRVVLPVGALLAVVADKDVSDADIDAFIAEFNANFSAQARQGGGGPTAETVDIDGKRITYLKVGPDEGQPVVFVHGFGSDHKAWLFNQAPMSETNPTYALDLPGHGASHKDAADLSAAALAGVVTAFIREMKLDGVHLVGHSLGGAISVLVAAGNPGLVRSVTLIAPAGLGSEISGPFFDGFIGEVRGKKLRPFIEMLVADPSIVTGEMVEDVLKFKRLDGAQQALEAVRAANFPGSAQKVSVRDALAGLMVPVQVIVGEDDKVIPAGQSAGLGNVQRIAIAGAGHIPHLEKAADVNEHIKSFVAKGS